MLALYGHPFSSYTWKAKIALYANGTPFEFREWSPQGGAHKAFVDRAHPAGKFPVLDDDGTVAIEGTAIVEHLAVHHPGPAPLIPADAGEAVHTRMLDRVFDNYVMASMQRIVDAYIADAEHPDPGEIEAGKRGLARVYRWLEEHFDTLPLRPHVSLVTCAAAPSLFYADWVAPIPDACPKLAAYRAELLALPAVARCVEEARPYRAWFPPGAPDRD